MEKRKEPTQHRMTRRSATHDYTRPGIYHITMHAADSLGQLFGMVVPMLSPLRSECPSSSVLPSPSQCPSSSVLPSPSQCPPVLPAGKDSASPSGATVSLSPIGQMVEHQLLTAITAHYPMITVDTYVIMPEHLHFILIVRDPIMSSKGRPTHLGQVIAGFKTGCNRAFWAMTENGAPAAKPQGTLASPSSAPVAAPIAAPSSAPAAAPPSAPVAPSVPAGFAGGKQRFSSGRPSLFADNYSDVMPIEPGQLETQRAYIRNNPQSRWLRSHNRDSLQTQRNSINTALSPAALCRYLKQVCPPSVATPDALYQIACHLLLADGIITCDSYGDHSLLERRLLPVVCHQKDKPRFAEQKRRCLDEAAKGAILVSARIAKGEQEIINDTVRHGFAVVLIANNGFPERYHPSAERIALCNEGKLLLVSPWKYQYRGKNEVITTTVCKTMNCVAQALCRLRDDWWKAPAEKTQDTLTAPGSSARTPAGSAASVPAGSAASVPAGSASGKLKVNNKTT